jgi:hypothetical protein
LWCGTEAGGLSAQPLEIVQGWSVPSRFYLSENRKFSLVFVRKFTIFGRCGPHPARGVRLCVVVTFLHGVSRRALQEALITSYSEGTNVDNAHAIHRLSPNAPQRQSRHNTVHKVVSVAAFATPIIVYLMDAPCTRLPTYIT